MKSPFPGMDPYLEAPDVWPDLHDALAGEIRTALNGSLPPPYYARLEMRPEIGIVVDAPAEAANLCGVLDDVLAHAYRVELRQTESGGSRIEWRGLEDGHEVRYTTSPKSSAWQRFQSTFYGLLPIEPLL